MAEREDFLGLSLRCPGNQDTPLSPSHKLLRTDDRYSVYRSSLFCGIDVIECAVEGAGVMDTSPNSAVSSVSGKRNERDENDGERASSSLEMDEDGIDAAARKKLRLTKEQTEVLEETFKESNTLNPKQKKDLSKYLNLKPRQIEVWFQNRRARTKSKRTEEDCEFLKRCCDNLTNENRRLKKELNDLQALSMPFYMNMTPPTTLTMCPQCEHVAPSTTRQRPCHNPPMPASSMIPPQTVRNRPF